MNQLAQNAPVARWKRLGDMLLEVGLITEGQLEEGLAEKERRKCFLGQALVRLGYLSQDELIAFLVKQCKIPHINLIDYSIDPRIVALLPNDLCLQYQLIAIDSLGTILTVAMVNPLDLDALEQARSACPNLKLKPILCTPEHFEIVAKRLLISEDSASSKASAPLDLSSFGLAALPPSPPRRAQSVAPPSVESTLRPEPLWAKDDFNLLLRDMLGELLGIFQGPLPGGLASVAHESLEFSFSLSVAGTLSHVSEGVSRVLGYPAARFQEAFLELLTDHPGNSVLRRAVSLALSGNQSVPIEAEFRAADGSSRMLLIVLLPVFDTDQSLLAVQAVARDISRRAQTEEYVYLNATLDPLTGLQNRRSFMARLEKTLPLAARHHIPTSVAVINLDNFTKLNRDLGKIEGDRILSFIGLMLRESLRAEDIIARTGGDEFCVLMPLVLPEAARNGMDRYLERLSNTHFSTIEGRRVPLPVTAAIISIGTQIQEADQFLDRARALVAQGKKAGGNRVLTELG